MSTPPAPRPTPKHVCQYCGDRFPTDSLCTELHEPTCPQRPVGGTK